MVFLKLTCVTGPAGREKYCTVASLWLSIHDLALCPKVHEFPTFRTLMPSCRASDPYGMCLICSVCRQFLTNFCRLIVCACIFMPTPSARVRHCAASLGSFLRPSLTPRTLIRYRALRSRISWPDDLDRQIYPSCGAKFIAPPVYQRQRGQLFPWVGRRIPCLPAHCDGTREWNTRMAIHPFLSSKQCNTVVATRWFDNAHDQGLRTRSLTQP